KYTPAHLEFHEILYEVGKMPEGYRLYEYVEKEKPVGRGIDSTRMSNTDSDSPQLGRKRFTTRKKSLVVFGHPWGPTRVYTDMQDFVEHLKWLGFDQTHNRENCACQQCSRKPDLYAKPSHHPQPSQSTPTIPNTLSRSFMKPTSTLSSTVSQISKFVPIS